ncbi:class I SAM-dependent DNA methyltransferase [Pseudooceanicola sp. C21-150M6]|uniref:class I SAM-dependent DNA methyltransferase n=1 Tax=Pseudooceanicola sp. C21-150M6 TaxID=3434355 RepID=UPI003D7F4780
MRPADRIRHIYHTHAAAWPRRRRQDLMERPWLDRFLAALPDRRHVLDLGCADGRPMAGYLIEQGCRITGVDVAPAMVARAQQTFPDQDWHVGDMRDWSGGSGYDGLLGWHSFFHLPPEDQPRMIARFAALTGPGGVVMFTSGTKRGEAYGEFEGERLYHGSLDRAEYSDQLTAHGFEVLAHQVEDPDCGGATVWLARKTTPGSQ